MDHVLDCLQARGLVDAVTAEGLYERLHKPIRLYLGFDPTADSLHLGHLTGMMVMAWFQKFGHTPVVILGGATGRIGDPSGKSIERPLLSEEEIASNVESLRLQFARVLDFHHASSPAKILDNYSWFGQYSLLHFLRDIGRHFRVGAMLGKESVRARIESEEGISFTEFSYQLLQAYDFYYLQTHENVELQLGGSDQWGNITAGLDLIRKLVGKQAYGFTFPLLTRSDGKKFGKTEGGAVWLDENKLSPYQFYQYLVRLPDADVIRLMKMLTFMELDEIASYEADMQKPEYIPNTAQKRLAEEVTRLVHGEENLLRAQKATEGAAPGSDAVLDVKVLEAIAQDLPNLELPVTSVVGQKLLELVVLAGLLPSKSESQRMMQNGGIYLNNRKETDVQRRLSADDLIGQKYLLVAAGKKKKALIRCT